MKEASVEVVASGLHKSFGDHSVLRSLDLTVPAGRLTAVLGTSGSGKTTLLRIVAGFEMPDSGSVTVGGVVLDDGKRHVRPERRRIGYVSQEGSLFPHLNVAANVGFGLLRRDRKGPRVSELLDAVGLSGLGGRYPHQLSGGQQQRVALARSLAVGSQVVLLDEPFNTLDANLRASVRADVHSILHEAGTTAILVTHDQDEALFMADLVAVIRNGMIAQVATPTAIYDEPVDADLASFVGRANLVSGTVTGGAVDTPLGRLKLRPNAASSLVDKQRVTVLIRPEQVVVDGEAGADGVPGHLLSADFHGSDTVVKVALALEGVGSPISARLLGTLDVTSSDTVRVRVAGEVWAWPADAPRAAGGDAKVGDAAAR